jgi:hypothetical protein
MQGGRGSATFQASPVRGSSHREAGGTAFKEGENGATTGDRYVCHYSVLSAGRKKKPQNNITQYSSINEDTSCMFVI